MSKKELIIMADYSQGSSLTAEEVCEICHVTLDLITDLVKHDIVVPMGERPDHWIFTIEGLRRVQKALRLSHDLEMDLAAVALVLHLLDEMENMRAQIKLYEKHFTHL